MNCWPSVQGVFRRGLQLEALKEFILSQGASKNVTLQEWEKLWSINKRIIDPVCPRCARFSPICSWVRLDCILKEGCCLFFSVKQFGAVASWGPFYGGIVMIMGLGCSSENPPLCRHTAIKNEGRVLLHLKDGPSEPEVVSVPKHKKYPPAGTKATTRTRVIFPLATYDHSWDVNTASYLCAVFRICS